RLELEFRQKAREFETQSRQLNQEKAQADREMLEQLKPKLDQAVETVIQAGNYDLVIDRSAVVDVKPNLDITRQVIERLNSLRWPAWQILWFVPAPGGRRSWTPACRSMATR